MYSFFNFNLFNFYHVLFLKRLELNKSLNIYYLKNNFCLVKVINILSSHFPLLLLGTN